MGNNNTRGESAVIKIVVALIGAVAIIVAALINRSSQFPLPSVTPVTQPLMITEPAFTSVVPTLTMESINQLIAFTSNRSGNYEIYTTYLDSSHLTNLTNNTGNDYAPAWSPDGSKIAFVSDRDGDDEIYVMASDGTEIIRLTDNDDNDGVPSWSPDSKYIAYQSMRNNQYDIIVLRLDGSEGEKNLTINSSTDDTYPAWSPNGEQIAFVSYRDDGIPQIFFMNSDGTGLSNFSQNSFCNNGPSWSPDGQNIAFIVGIDTNQCLDSNLDIYVINISSKRQENITNTSENDEGVVTWSPDGEHIAFQSKKKDQKSWNIYTMNFIKRQSMTLIEDNADSYWPDWSPRLSK